MSDDEVRFNVAMPERLRDDAKRNTERGELSQDVRDLFRRKAYGSAGTSDNTELEQTQAELNDVRDRIDELRKERRRIDAEIETQESRATRLEERVEKLENNTEKFDTVLETLESILLDGGRIYPERVDDELEADRVIQELRSRNPDVPDEAFRLSKPDEPFDWRES